MMNTRNDDFLDCCNKTILTGARRIYPHRYVNNLKLVLARRRLGKHLDGQDAQATLSDAELSVLGHRCLLGREVRVNRGGLALTPRDTGDACGSHVLIRLEIRDKHLRALICRRP